MPRPRKINKVVNERGIQRREACRQRIAELAAQSKAVATGNNAEFLRQKAEIDRDFHKQRVKLYKALQQQHHAITRSSVGNRECIQMATEHRVLAGRKIFAAELEKREQGRVQEYKDALKRYEFLDKEIQEKKKQVAMNAAGSVIAER